MGKLRRNPLVCIPGGRLRPRAEVTTAAARCWPAVDGRDSLESGSVSLVRSARVRRYAVMLVALVVVVWAVRFVLTPFPRM
jgi:hypothetical protein